MSLKVLFVNGLSTLFSAVDKDVEDYEEKSVNKIFYDKNRREA